MRLRLPAALLATASLAAPSAAHHGWSGYLPTESAVSGSVTSADMRGGMHARMFVRSGGERWEIVLGPPSRNGRAGLTAALLRPGTQVVARGHRHRDPRRLELMAERVVIGGRAFDLYPERS